MAHTTNLPKIGNAKSMDMTYLESQYPNDNRTAGKSSALSRPKLIIDVLTENATKSITTHKEQDEVQRYFGEDSARLLTEIKHQETLNANLLYVPGTIPYSTRKKIKFASICPVKGGDEVRVRNNMKSSSNVVMSIWPSKAFSFKHVLPSNQNTISRAINQSSSGKVQKTNYCQLPAIKR